MLRDGGRTVLCPWNAEKIEWLFCRIYYETGQARHETGEIEWDHSRSLDVHARNFEY